MGFTSRLLMRLGYKLIQNCGAGNGKLYPSRCIHLARYCAMDRQLPEWKLSVERIWSAATPDYGEAARLAAEIASASEEITLRQAAAQALPSCAAPRLQEADQSTEDAARRRLGVIRDVLHALTTPQVRQARPIPKSRQAPEERYRELLELPLGRRLSGAEIHRAWKRAAKRAHPDTGGSAQQFLEMSTARDALMKYGEASLHEARDKDQSADVHDRSNQSAPGKRCHALDLDQHRGVRQRLHHACRAGRIGGWPKGGSIQCIHRGDIGRTRQQHVDLGQVAKLAPASSSTRLMFWTTKPNWASKVSGSAPFWSSPGMPETNSRSPVRVAKESGGALIAAGGAKCWIGAMSNPSDWNL